MNKIALLFLLLLFVLLPFRAASAAEPPLTILTGEVTYVNLSGGFYGIIGDDGIKYQPTNLSPQLRKTGQPVKFTFEPAKNGFSSILWGTIIDIKSAARLEPPLTAPERTALRLLLQRMDAFNSKDLKKLQEIDSMARSLLPEQFAEWVGDYTFTLRYLDIDYHDSLTIRGACIYTRQATAEQESEMSLMKFSIDRRKEGWKIVKTVSEPSPYTLAEVIQAAGTKYGTADLAKLWP